MKVILNDNFQIDKVDRVTEILEPNLRKRINISIQYSQQTYQKIENFIRNNSVTLIKTFSDADTLINVFTKYNEFRNLAHSTNLYGEMIELSFFEEINE